MKTLGDDVMVLEKPPEDVGQLFLRIHRGYQADTFDPITVGLGAIFYGSLLTGALSPRFRRRAFATTVISGVTTLTRAFFLEDYVPTETTVREHNHTFIGEGVKFTTSGPIRKDKKHFHRLTISGDGLKTSASSSDDPGHIHTVRFRGEDMPVSKAS